jgi:hypothetical protein
MASRKEAMHSGPERYATVALSMLKPADLRFTLPALFRRDKLTNEEKLIGFPTLDISTGQLGYPKDICSWRVHYKKLDCDAALDSNIADTCSFREGAGVSHRMIEREIARLSRTRPDTDPSSRDAFDDHAAFPSSTDKIVRRPRTSRFAPSAESRRHGRSEKGKRGGYKVKWEDLEDLGDPYKVIEDPYKVSR